ncbi:uncharacterized protein BDV14DRAFT_202970 [Aspergillus stella-maris]|uniref:uncharacterized protein n=1 Tax=Aspergillus stella-maris TaxID=1810926 RepID=UPI003CCCCBB1
MDSDTTHENGTIIPLPEPLPWKPSSHPPLSPSPLRILIQTITHLIPSDELPELIHPHSNPYGVKINSMLNRICQLTWGCAWEPGVHRWYGYGDDEFGYNNRLCFFVVDAGTTDND